MATPKTRKGRTQRRRNDNINKICVLEGVGEGKIYGKLSKTLFVLGNVMTIKFQVRKNSLNIKFLGGIFLGHPGPRRRGIPDKNFMQVAFFSCFREGAAGMSRDLGRDVPDLVKLYARKLWADFQFPKLSQIM